MEICAVPQVTHYRQVWLTDLVLLLILYRNDIDIARAVLRTLAERLKCSGLGIFGTYIGTLNT